MTALQSEVLSWFAALPGARRAGTIGPETDLIETGVLDSLAILNAIGFLETRFNIVVPVEAFTPDNFRTVRAMSDMVASLGGQS